MEPLVEPPCAVSKGSRPHVFRNYTRGVEKLLDSQKKEGMFNDRSAIEGVRKRCRRWRAARVVVLHATVPRAARKRIGATTRVHVKSWPMIAGTTFSINKGMMCITGPSISTRLSLPDIAQSTLEKCASCIPKRICRSRTNWCLTLWIDVGTCSVRALAFETVECE